VNVPFLRSFVFEKNNELTIIVVAIPVANDNKRGAMAASRRELMVMRNSYVLFKEKMEEPIKYISNIIFYQEKKSHSESLIMTELMSQMRLDI
jgi:hypothetical protein